MSGYIGKGQPVAVEDGSVEIDDFSATGTASSTTFLRGDNSWTTVDTDLVSDTTPKLGGNLDTNGKTLDTVNLEAYSDITSITGNAVDIFIYDTSKDSDGGAWRKRTQDTSWYNEASSTTRGSRKDFPAVAVIVATTTNVTIYDGDTPDLDMWMVFEKGGNDYFYTNPSAVIAKNSFIAMSSGSYDIWTATFLSDSGYRMGDSSGVRTTHCKGNISQRNDGLGYGANTGVGLVNRQCNDIAITVLPNAPIDSSTGLPTPTIAVATDGGVSVIKDDGTVVDIATDGTASRSDAIDFISSDGSMVVGCGTIGTGTRHSYTFALPTIDGTYSNRHRTDLGDGTTASDIRFSPVAAAVQGVSSAKNSIALRTNTESFALLKENLTTPSKGSVAYINSKYNTGYMTGDIRGAWNVDTDVTSLSGTELVTNGTFASDTGWTKGSGWTVSGGTAVATNVSSGIVISQTVTLPIAGEYIISVNVVTANSTYYFGINGGSTGSQSGTGVMQITTGYLSAGTRTLSIGAWSSGLTATFDDISVRLAIPDRSVKGNGLAVYGTPTVSAVATGAELKCISGFSSSNYLGQPNTSDTNFTGDYCFTGWVKRNNGTSYRKCIAFQSVTGNQSQTNSVNIKFSNGHVLYANLNGVSLEGSGPIQPYDTWIHTALIRSNGVAKLYINGVSGSGSVSYTTTVGGSNHVLRLGADVTGTEHNPGSLALWRVSATAPTAEQIKEIYEAEKPLFQDNAKCTLNGTSDAVTAMSYDDSNEELLVGTSGGLSVFKGLRRVDENTNNITEVAQQGGLRVEEY